MLARYKANGAPGITSVSDESMAEMMEMFLKGNSFSAISQYTRIPKEKILFLAEKNKWPDLRRERLGAMIESFDDRSKTFVIENSNFILDLCSVLRHYYETKIKQYLKTKDPEILESMDRELIKTYMRSLEALSDMSKKGGKGDLPPAPTYMNITMNEGAALNVKQDRIASNDLSEVLKAIADMNRAKDNPSKEKK